MRGNAFAALENQLPPFSLAAAGFSGTVRGSMMPLCTPSHSDLGHLSFPRSLLDSQWCG